MKALLAAAVVVFGASFGGIAMADEDERFLLTPDTVQKIPSQREYALVLKDYDEPTFKIVFSGDVLPDDEQDAFACPALKKGEPDTPRGCLDSAFFVLKTLTKEDAFADALRMRQRFDYIVNVRDYVGSFSLNAKDMDRFSELVMVTTEFDDATNEWLRVSK